MTKYFATLSLALAATACGGSYPPPTQRMADAQSAERSAQELGAAENPQAELHLKLAQEQLAKAKAVLKTEDNRRADFMLIRAKADAELAIAIARAEKSKLEAQQALEESRAQAATNASQGAQ
jgi:hypothetical protein